MRVIVMILTDNLNVLRLRYRSALEVLNKYKEIENNGLIKVEETKSGYPTLEVMEANRPLYVHSKYDPVKEADRLVDQYSDADQYEHVLFYGTGLGYHIEAFINRYPHLSFTIYEPSVEIAYKYLSLRKLNDLPISSLKEFHIETTPEETSIFLQQFANNVQNKNLFVCLPSYERIFKEKYQQFTDNFKEAISNKRNNVTTNFAFEKRWTINSMLNVREVLTTPNILCDVSKDQFKDKPVLLVAAGPSLEEEIENIRKIKKSGQAYIFTVGSANKLLIQKKIYPDAVCTYDPQSHNYKVFSEIIDNNITSIPMIFGSSVGYETLEKYPGPKLHMLTNQDTVAPYYLKLPSDERIEYVNDAPSIAVVTLELLDKLGCSPIILVGQNLAYKDKQYYSKGIQYETRKTSLDEKDLQAAIEVEGVDGTKILTNKPFNLMRLIIEKYIEGFHNTEIINTTKGGAQIKGTSFIPLEEVMSERLVDRGIVQSFINKTNNSYDLSFANKQQDLMDKELSELDILFNQFRSILVDMDNWVRQNQKERMDKQFVKLDKKFKQIKNNHFFRVILQPMLRVQIEVLSKKVQSIKFEKNTVVKTQTIVQLFSNFLFECQKDMQNIQPIYHCLRKSFLGETPLINNDYKSKV
jgi:hypothetical protein